MDISLNLFTNVIPSAPDTTIIRKTYESFKQTFGPLVPTVYCDPHPNARMYRVYEKNLHRSFKNIVQTTSLSDGYIKSILQCRSEWLFQLEGDWIFQSKLIDHSLDEIIKVMRERGIYHFRFNKRDTIIKGWDKQLDEKICGNLKYCMTNILSNNPHIIHRPTFINFVKEKKIVVRPGSKGIEEIISEFPETRGAIYGPMGYPKTVLHIDGRGKHR